MQEAMHHSTPTIIVGICVAIASASPTLDQATPAEPRQATPAMKYEPIAAGVQQAQIFRTDALRDVIVEVKDVLFGPGKSAPTIPVQGFEVTELKSGEVETTIDGQTAKRRPGNFWLVNPGQKYSITAGPGPAVLHVTVFTHQ